MHLPVNIPGLDYKYRKGLSLPRLTYLCRLSVFRPDGDIFTLKVPVRRFRSLKKITVIRIVCNVPEKKQVCKGITMFLTIIFIKYAF